MHTYLHLRTLRAQTALSPCPASEKNSFVNAVSSNYVACEYLKYMKLANNRSMPLHFCCWNCQLYLYRLVLFIIHPCELVSICLIMFSKTSTINRACWETNNHVGKRVFDVSQQKRSQSWTTIGVCSDMSAIENCDISLKYLSCCWISGVDILVKHSLLDWDTMNSEFRRKVIIFMYTRWTKQ